jgi:DNA-binding protein YbaB
LADWQQQTPQPGQQADRRPEASEQELAARIVEVAAGGGAVRVRVDGRGRVRHLSLEPAAFEQRDAELLADLVLGAIAEAQRRALELSPADGRPAGSPLPGAR